MRKRTKYLLLTMVLAMVLVGVVVVAFLPSSEPSYQGKRLSEWVEQYEEYEADREIEAKEQSDRAVRHIGGAAVPYLLTWISYETPTSLSMLERALQLVPERLRPSWAHLHGADIRTYGAISGFRALGSKAHGAIPKLGSILNDRKANRSAERAAKALQYLGNDAITPLVQVVTNQQAGFVRLIAVSSIRFMGTNARVAAPSLIQCLEDGDELFAVNVADTILKVENRDPALRSAAVAALCKIVPEAPKFAD